MLLIINDEQPFLPFITRFTSDDHLISLTWVFTVLRPNNAIVRTEQSKLLPEELLYTVTTPSKVSLSVDQMK